MGIDSTTALSSDEHLLFELISTDIWTSLFEKVNLRESKSIWITQLTDLNDYQLVLRCEDGLRIFQYSQKDCTWQQILYSEEFCDQNGFNKSCYPIQFWRISQLNKDILICRLQSGYYFAEYDALTQTLRGLTQDFLFPDMNGWYHNHNHLQWGSFYGPDMPLGLFTQHNEQGIRFYVLTPNGFKQNERPIWEDIITNKNIQSQWHVKNDYFEFADITETGMTNIIRQNDQGLSIYGFQVSNEGFTLTELIKTDLCNKNSGWRPKRDKLWFVRLTKSHFSNLVLLQSDGLKVYEYIDSEKRFRFLNHDRSMTERSGWNKQHVDSIFFADINDNEFMQLIYTGPQGLTIRSFNPVIHQWEYNLNPNQLNFENKYATAVMFIPAKRSPTRTSILITKYNDKLNCFTIKKKIIELNEIDYSLQSNFISSSDDMKITQSRLILLQTEWIDRGRSVIYLRDTLDIKPLLSAVNTNTGKLDITLPLISMATGPKGLQMQLALRYQGINQHATILGIGWHLVEDYIAVDYQRSINPSLHRYYWITSHGSIPLRCRRSQIQRFQLATSYDLYLIKSLNIDNLPEIQDNAVILVGPQENKDYYAYHIQNNKWLRNRENKKLKTILMKKIEVMNFEPTGQNGFIEITDKNFENIVKIIRIVTSNENYFDMNITYDSVKQYWQMKTPEGEKRLYGHTSDSIAWSIGWDNWMGIGNDTKYQKLYPVRWHLNEIQGYETNKIIYTYENLQRPVGNESFTQSMYLKSITDNNDNIIYLNYEKKSFEEFQELVLKDSDGNLQFEPNFDSYLKNIEIITRVNSQKIEFEYLVNKKVRQLIALSQKEDIYPEPVLKFSYNDFLQIDRIQLPNGKPLDFTYNLNKLEYMKHSLDDLAGEYVVKEQPQITMGSDYLILSEINEKVVNFRILKSKQSPSVNIIKSSEVQMYRTFARQDYFGFILKTVNNTFNLFLYHCYRFFQPKQYEISSFKIQWIDHSLILVNSQQQIILIDWNNEEKTWQENILPRPLNISQNSEIFLTTNQSHIVVYDDQHLWINYRDLNKNWQTKFLKRIPNYFLQSKQTLEKFEINSIVFEDILQYLKLQTLQCSNNIICLSTWHEENGKFKSIVSIFMLNSNDNIQWEKCDDIIHEECYEEIFSNIQEQELVEGDKLAFRFMYQNHNGKFRVVFDPKEIKKDVEIQGTKYHRLYQLNDQNITITLQGIKKCVVYNKHTNKWFTEMDENLNSESQSLSKYLNEIFFIDLTKCLPQLNINQIISGNKKWIFNGNQWEKTIINEDVLKEDQIKYNLDRDYVLYKANEEDSLKLYEQNSNGEIIGDYLYDFKEISLENISIGYPNYIAFKKKDNGIFVLPIYKKKIGEIYHLPDGNFTSWSNSQLLIIAKSNTQDEKNQKLIIYSNPGHSDLYVDPVIINTCLEIGNEKRINGYHYYEESAIMMNDFVAYQKTDTIPGADKSRYGWIENTTESEHIQRRYFNSKQEEISAPLVTNKSKDKTKSESLSDPQTTLFLPRTNFEIAQFHTANIQDDEGTYLGFEPYEIENSSAWQFQRTDLIKNDWPLTGTSYLRLHNKNDCIHRIFNPKNQNHSYQVACWLRSTDKNFPSKNEFQATIKTNKNDIIGTLSSNLLSSRNEWYYFEININLPEIKYYGALKPICSTKFNDKLCYFQEEIIEIENQDDYAFIALGISRKSATEQLLANIHSIELRSLIADEIQVALLQDTLPDIMKSKTLYQNLHKKYKEHQEKINQDVQQINEILGLNANHQLDLIKLLEYMQHESKYQNYYQQLNQLKEISDQIKIECDKYSKLEDTFKDFIEHGQLNCLRNFKDNQIISPTFDVITQLNNIQFYIWKTNFNNELILFHTNQDKINKPQQTIHLLYASNLIEFRKLIDITHTCLSQDKRESLRQGHDYLLIDIIIQPTSDYSLDIDHIRFSPRDQKFYARIYDPKTYQVTALLDGNGSIKYMFYNNQCQPFAVTDWKKYLKELSIYGRHGYVCAFGSKLAHRQPRCEIQIKPMHGFYEDFSKISFEERWSIETITCWKRTPGCFIHTEKSSDSLILENDWLDEHSAGIYVQLNLQVNAKIEIKIHHHLLIIECLNDNKTNLIINSQDICLVPSYGEYLIIIEDNRLWLWINGQLQFDERLKVYTKNSNYLSFNLTGNISLDQLFVFSQPTIDVTYKNILDEELQTIHLENSQAAIVTQTLYDDLGRQAIVTKPTRVIVDDDKPLLAFQNDFIQNQNNNVSQTSQLIGTVNKFNPKDEGYCYFQVRYADNPLNEKIASGQPGRLFTVNEIGSIKYTRDIQSDFISLLFPSKQGYSFQVCIQPHGTKHITVLDSHENQVALYVYTNTGNNLLTTYEYNDENRLVKVLPPIYHAHKKIDTLSQTIPYTQLMDQWQNNEHFQKKFSIRMVYNRNGKVIERITPDTSKQILIYSQENLLRFILQHDFNGKPCRVIYYQYDQWGDLSSQGYSTECSNQEELQNLANNYKELSKEINYLRIMKNNSSVNVNFRNKFVTFIIKHSEGMWQESSTYKHGGKLFSREIIISNTNLWQIYRLDYTYCGDHVASITYPMLFKNQPLIIIYSRNKQNHITAIGTPNNNEQWLKFTYAGHGQMSDEIHIVNSFITHYDYNSPGYLETIQNKYFQEIISYTEGSYGQGGFFDGTIARTQFSALWFDHCDTRLLSLNPETFRQYFETAGLNITLKQAEHYLQVLVNAGFLDQHCRVIKEFLLNEAVLYLPRECGGTFACILAELLNHYFPPKYGHYYSYGNHMELIKAKYVVGEKILKPIQPLSFTEKINQINPEQSKLIWQILVDNIYIYSDNDDGVHIQGKVNTDKWIDYERLKENLGNYADYDHLLATILQKYFSQREILTLEKIQNIFLTWLHVDTDTEQKTIEIYLETAKQIWTILSNENHLYSTNRSCSLLKNEFYQILENYHMFIPEILSILQEYSVYQMGGSPGDVEAYWIDENGNHRHYWTGYARFQLHYKENTNQIESIDYKLMSRNKPQTNFKIVHDTLGNITKAEHKGILDISYDPTTNRPKRIQLQDGRQVYYDYDAQGERVRKCINNKNGEKLKEILYLRDDEGRSLVEKVVDFIDGERFEQETGYIYGSKGVIGFIRNDEFYSVICDHEGSIRLIVKDQEVVAAYDYLPYGTLIRQYGIPQVQIPYRYTGQEWDEETGLYNYHARLYDPEIGRFYQIDPQEQYASPYKYAGNSPVSMIDPSGEIAFLPVLMIGLGLLGGYLGGSAANNSWSPLEWDFMKTGTYLGIGGGIFMGALAPVGLTASIATLTAFGLSTGGAIGVTSTIGGIVMYLSMGAANDSWNPAQWRWSRPMTWNAGFQGFIFGAGVPSGIGAWHQYYTCLETVGKVAFLLSSGTLALGMSYLSCATANGSFNPKQWKLSPGTIYAGVGGAFGGCMAPVGLMSTWQTICSFETTTARLLMGCTTIGFVLCTSYVFISAANDSFFLSNWDMSSPKTYTAIIGGILFGISLPGLPRAFTDGIKRTSDTWRRIKNCGYFEKEMYKVDQELAKEIVAECEAKINDPLMNIPQPSDRGAICIVRTADGKIYYAYSGRDGNAVFYGEVLQDGPQLNYTVEPSKDFPFETIETKMNISKTTMTKQSNAPKVPHTTIPRNPGNCAEPRAMSLAFKAGYSPENIATISTFRRDIDCFPLATCGYCSQYVPGKTYTDEFFRNPFGNSFDYVIFASQFSIQQFRHIGTTELREKND